MIVAGFLVVLLLILVTTDYTLNDLNRFAHLTKQISPTGDFRNSKENKFWTKVSSLYSKSDIDKQRLIELFPLTEAFFQNEKYSDLSMKTFSDPLPQISGKLDDFKFNVPEMCMSLEYSSKFQVSKQEYLGADFEKIQKALRDSKEYSKLIEQAKDKFRPTIPEEKQWFRFGGSSAWLPQYNLHYMVSRVLYSPSGIANKAFVSFLYVQLYDKDWKELPETTITVSYDQKVTKNVMNADGSMTKVILDKSLSSRDITYPSLLPITFDVQMFVENGKYYYGPEDPRILVRKNSLGFDEPLIVFNMKSTKLVKRVMHLYQPFSNQLQVLKKRTEPYAHIEKNWTPFISESNVKSKHDSINFIYSIDPMEVLTCEVDTALCDFVQKAEKKNKNFVGPLRGGSQLVKLPFDRLLPKHILDHFKLPENRQIYVGWARAHLNKCGCGESMYRPNLIVLTEDYIPADKKFYYKLSDVSEYFDFNAYVPPWTTPKKDKDGNFVDDPDPKQCSGRNVLIPNSIAYWDIESVVKDNVQYARNHFDKIPTNDQSADLKAAKVTKYRAPRDEGTSNLFFNDYMGVTLSAADSDVSIVHVRGLLNYILKLPSLFDQSTVVSSDAMFAPNGYELNNVCAMRASKDYCVQYAENHGGVTKY